MCQCCAEKKDIYLPQLATVADISQMNVTEKYLRLSMDDGQFDFLPGQFVEVSIAGIGEAPITISSSPTLADSFELVVRKIGRVSGAIHNLKRGDKLGIRGPLGKGIYPVEEAKGKNLVFICGGIGMVPQRSFINYVLDNRSDYGDVAILQGTKSYDLRLFTSEIEAWSKRGDVQMLETLDEGDARLEGQRRRRDQAGLQGRDRPEVGEDPRLRPADHVQVRADGPGRARRAAREHLPEPRTENEVRRRQVRTLPDQQRVCLHVRPGVPIF